MTKEEFLSLIIGFAPADSFWGVQGFYDKETIERFGTLLEKKGCEIDPIGSDYFIKLNRENKKTFISILKEGNIEHDIVHNYICKDGLTYFISYDHMVSNFIKIEFIPKKHLDIFKKESFIE